MENRVAEFWSNPCDIHSYRGLMTYMPIGGYKRVGKRIKRINIDNEYRYKRWKTL